MRRWFGNGLLKLVFLFISSQSAGTPRWSWSSDSTGDWHWWLKQAWVPVCDNNVLATHTWLLLSVWGIYRELTSCNLLYPSSCLAGSRVADKISTNALGSMSEKVDTQKEKLVTHSFSAKMVPWKGPFCDSRKGKSLYACVCSSSEGFRDGCRCVWCSETNWAPARLGLRLNGRWTRLLCQVSVL